jgi:hypothetical protein
MPVPTCATKRLRKAAGLMRSVNPILATTTSMWSDDVWVVDSTPVKAAAPARPSRQRTCPRRAEPLIHAGSAFAAPRRRDVAAWQTLTVLLNWQVEALNHKRACLRIEFTAA